MKKILSFLFVAILGLTLVACIEDEGSEGYAVQGITDEHIIVGNTAATSGGFASVGIPFNLAMQVVFDEYNSARTEGERTIEFKHYDDNFDGEQGLTYTKKLVEEDKVFALVGHFGTNTVEYTMDYLLETGVPMVYGVTGVNSLYFEPEHGGKNILSVQPIYRTEGQILVARLLHESVFGANGNQKLDSSSKIVVLHSEDDAGNSIKLGVEDAERAENVATGRMIYIPFSATTADAAVTTALTHNPGAIIMAANQAPATAAATALAQKGSEVPVFSSYVNSQAVFIPAQQTNEDEELLPLPYDVYANAWVDIVDPTQEAPTAAMVGREGILVGFNDAGSALEAMGAGALAFLPGFTQEYWDFVKLLNESDRVSGDTSARMLWANPYAMAGYVAAKTFVALLDRVEDFHELTWESFVELAEEAPIKLPLAGTVDWKDGYRQGLIALALNKLTYPEGKPAEFAKVREIELLEDIRKK